MNLPIAPERDILSFMTVCYTNIFNKILWNKERQWLYSQDIQKCYGTMGNLPSTIFAPNFYTFLGFW